MTPVQKFIYEFSKKKHTNENWTDEQFSKEILEFEEIEFIEELMEEYATNKVSVILSNILKNNVMLFCDGRINISQDQEVNSRLNIVFYPDNAPVQYNIFWWDLINAIQNCGKAIESESNNLQKIDNNNGN